MNDDSRKRLSQYNKKILVAASIACTLASLGASTPTSFLKVARAQHIAEQKEHLTLQTVALLDAPTNSENSNPFGGAEIRTEDDLAFVASHSPSDFDIVIPSQDQISTYVVEEGDTLSAIAEMFDVSVNTIKWANNISKDTGIRMGQTLTILPVTGVRHTVKSGDTLRAIVKKYGGNEEDIIAFNDLDGTELEVGQEIIIPDGEVKTTSSKQVTQAPTQASGFFIRPLKGGRKTQGIHGYNAVDIATPIGTPVYASASGTVIISRSEGWNGGYGEYIVVKHSNGIQTLYAHLSGTAVVSGQSVAQGEVIGYSGNSGKSTGPHLHFEVRGAVNPF